LIDNVADDILVALTDARPVTRLKADPSYIVILPHGLHHKVMRQGPCKWNPAGIYSDLNRYPESKSRLQPEGNRKS
jgi:hypothetical protein